VRLHVTAAFLGSSEGGASRVKGDGEILAQVQMLIRRPVGEVFEAFVDPAVATKFWFTKSSGTLEAGKRLQWDWEMYGASAQVDVLEVEAHTRIVISWPYGPTGAPTTVEWTFTRLPDDTTFVAISHRGFAGSPEEVAEQAIGSTGGFAWVLAGAKALLEHHVELNLIADHAPPGLNESTG
jgi:uncharacterized protein YndB with AHSA1/START domain